MTDEVGELVLRDNVLQNLALSMTEALGPELLDAQTAADAQAGTAGPARPRGRVSAERRGADRAAQGRAGALPGRSCAVLLAYAKMTLYEDVLRTELPDRAYLARTTWPSISRARCDAGYADAIAQHRLQARDHRRPGSPTAWSIAASPCSCPSSRRRPAPRSRTSCSAYVDGARLLRPAPACGARSRNLPASVPGDLQTRLLVAVRDVAVRGTRWFMTQGGAAVPDARRRGQVPTGHRDGDDDSLDVVIGPRAGGRDRRRARRVFESAGVDAAVARRLPACRSCWPRATSCARRRPVAVRRPARGGPRLFRARRCARPALAQGGSSAPRRGAAAGIGWR